MVRRRNPSVVEFSSDSDEIQEESPVPYPPPRRSLSKRGRGSGRKDGEGSSMPSQPTRGRRQKVGASRPRRSTSSSGYAPCQEEDGAFDDFVDLPAPDALYVTGLHMHPANVSRGPHESPVDFTQKGIDTLQRLRLLVAKSLQYGGKRVPTFQQIIGFDDVPKTQAIHSLRITQKKKKKLAMTETRTISLTSMTRNPTNQGVPLSFSCDYGDRKLQEKMLCGGHIIKAYTGMWIRTNADKQKIP
uniref:Uncharacterized protein n=1 Tax=Zea mays TaxID=4577 RepID=A0A804QCT4_MAIZE